MVITDRFVYLHIPKTGGTFVEARLAQLLGNGPGLYIDSADPPHRGTFGCADQHERYCQVPLQHRDKQMLLTVRNPYDHHVSLYEFGWWKTHPGDTFDPSRIKAAYPHFPDLSFAQYLQASNDWGLNEPSYAPAGGYGVLSELEVGPLSFDFIRFLAPDPELVFANLPSLIARGELWSCFPPASFIPTHDLNAGLYRFLLSQGFVESQLESILSSDKLRPAGSTRTEAMHWASYYDDASRQLVRRRERLLFEMFPEFDV